MPKHKYIKTPEDLLKMWEDYKAYIDSTPDQIQKATNKGVQIELVDKPYQRKGFQAYVFRNYKFHVHQYIDNYENAYSEYLGVVTYMRDEWEENQISGTLTGKFKAPNLTARMNGIKDGTDVTSNGENINEIKISIIRPDTKEIE
jgi:hypothetical protein